MTITIKHSFIIGALKLSHYLNMLDCLKSDMLIFMHNGSMKVESKRKKEKYDKAIIKSRLLLKLEAYKKYPHPLPSVRHENLRIKK